MSLLFGLNVHRSRKVLTDTNRYDRVIRDVANMRVFVWR